ncbi:MAG: ABC transporter substrate-binding protein [Planctomycetaceae bacterium]|nr:ABC transporter substrate-binding protein [Planctomycetaceae bacterium]
MAEPGENQPQKKPSSSDEKRPTAKKRPTDKIKSVVRNGPAALLGEFREAQDFFYKTWGSAAALTILTFFIAWFFVEPAPPAKLTIAAGPRGGAYYEQASKFREYFAENGIELEIRETAGSIENYELLLADNDIHVAIVQGGTRPKGLTKNSLESLASLYLEPLWVFTKAESNYSQFRDLAGQSIAIGYPESGTEAIMKVLLKANGFIDQTPVDAEEPQPEEEAADHSPARFVLQGGDEAATLLKAGKVDAACFVMHPNNKLVRELMTDPKITLLAFDRQQAYRQLFPYLSDVILAEGVLDLENNIPPQEIPLIAPAANLVAAAKLHDAFVPLFIEAASTNFERENLLISDDKFPSLSFSEFQPHVATLSFFKSGPSLLYRYLPFWIASLLDRMKIMIIPLLTLTIPLVKIAPPVYRWRIRSRIYRWYDLLHQMDQRLEQADKEMIDKKLNALQTMESELETIKVPLSFMEEFYNLQVHLELVKKKIQRRAIRFENKNT